MSLIETTGTFNFRDFGGYTTSDGNEVSSGILFRSGEGIAMYLTIYLKMNRHLSTHFAAEGMAT